MAPTASSSGPAAEQGPRLPGRLAAKDPGWTTTADVVIVGTGIAGLTTALRLRESLGAAASVLDRKSVV